MSIAHKRLVQELLAPGLRMPVLEMHRGITENEAFVVYGVFKVGPVEAIDQELGIYRDLQARLGMQYNSIFPQVVLRHRNEHVAIIEMTWLGRSLNEEIFKPLAWGEWVSMLACSPNVPPIVAKLALADEAVARVLDYLEILFTYSQQDDTALAGIFTNEILTALQVNLQRAGLLPELKHDLATVEEAHELWSAGLVISCCHRDLMTEHIYLVQRDGALDVHLADPKASVPHFDEMLVGQTYIPNSLGCIAVDFAHLELSLARHQMELQRVYPDVEVVALERIRTYVSDWVTRERFSTAFYELALATWYANYAGWPSALGNVPPREQQWLFDHMVTEARQRLARCAALARGEDVSS